jgi:hypothetical protein
MIHRDLKFIFVRMAKTASTSILSDLFCRPTQNNKNPCDNEFREYSGKLFKKRTFLLEETYKENLADSWPQTDNNHIPLYYMKKNLDKKTFDSFFKFGFVRNPYDRLSSAYLYSIWLASRGTKTTNHTSFKQFLCKIKLSDKYGLQHTWVEGCDFVGKYENLQNDFDYVCSQLKIKKAKLLELNKDIKKSIYENVYCKETRDYVNQNYYEDFEKFNYEMII